MSKLHIIDIRDTLETFYNLMECPKINIIVTTKKSKIKGFLACGFWPKRKTKVNNKQQKNHVLVVKNLLANARDIRDVDPTPELGGYLEKGTATHSSILAWRIPWT